MNDEIKALLIKIGIMILTALAAKLHLDPTLSSMYPAIAADVADGLLLAYTIYLNRGMKKVPVDAHATVFGATVSKAGETKVKPVDLAGKINTGGAGVIILCILAMSSHDARAQRLQRDDAQVTTGSDQGVAKIGAIIGRVKQFTINDLTAAAADADNQVPPDPAGDCWRALIPVIQTQQSLLPAGLGLAQAIQKARDLQRRAQRGVSDDIKAKCAIVLWDAEAALIKLGVNIAPVPKLPGLPF